MDNHSVHRSSEVLEFVKKQKGKLCLFFLPPYSPELNPNDHGWNYLKNHKIGRQTTKNGFELLVKRVQSIMLSLQKMPEKVKSFFRHPWTKYLPISMLGTNIFGYLGDRTTINCSNVLSTSNRT